MKLDFSMAKAGDKYIGELEFQRPDGEYDVWTIVKRLDPAVAGASPKGYPIYLIGTATNSGLLSDYYYKPERGESESKSLEEIQYDLEYLALEGKPSGMSNVKIIPKKGLKKNPPFYAHNLYEKKTHGLTLHQMRRLYAMVSRGNQKAITYARNVLGIPFSESPSQVKAVVYHHVRDLAERRVRRNPGGGKQGWALVRGGGPTGMKMVVVSIHKTKEGAESAMMRKGGTPDSQFTRGYSIHAFGPGTRYEYLDSEFTGKFLRPLSGNPASSDVTPVVFRTFRSGGEVIALFPYEPGTMDPGTMMSYQHIGQHGPADMGLTSVHTRPSTPDEIRPLRNELERIGYKLKILKRIPGDAVRVRAEKIRSIK